MLMVTLHHDQGLRPDIEDNSTVRIKHPLTSPLCPGTPPFTPTAALDLASEQLGYQRLAPAAPRS